MSKTEFTKGVAWFEPFYAAVEPMLAKSKRIARVVGYTAPYTSVSLAACSTGNQRTFTISVAAWYWLDPERTKKVPVIAQHMLENFAHEVAHVKHWEHTPDHVIFTAKILKKFGQVAKEMGLKNLEVRRCKKLGKLY